MENSIFKPTQLPRSRPDSSALVVVINFIFALAVSCCGSVSAEEPMNKFVEVLRDQGYFDVALEYLEGLKDSDAISAEDRQRIPLEQARTLSANAANARDLSKADALLDQAQQLLDQYARSAQSPLLAYRAFQYRGDLLFNRARISAARAGNERTTASEKAKFDEQTRSLLESASTNYSDAKQNLKTVLADFQIDPEDPTTITRRRELRVEYTGLRVQQPIVSEMLADTLPDGNERRTQLLKETAEQSLELWEKYRAIDYAQGPALGACLAAARCYQKLGDHKQCLAILEDIFDLKRNAALNTIKRKAFAIAVTSWRQAEPYPWQQVVGRLATPVSLINSQDAMHPEWLKVQLELARGLQAKAAEVAKVDGAEAKRDARDMLRTAAKLASKAARVPGEHRSEALDMLAKLNVDAPAAPIAENTQPPENFSEAQQRGKEILADVEPLLGQISLAQQKLARAKSVEEKSAAQTSLQQLDRRNMALTDSALEMFSRALTLADKDTTRDEVNGIRYLQSFCYFARRQYIESSVIGEFLLDKYPNVAGSRQAAAIMIKSYALLLDAATGEKAFERDRLTSACNAVIDRWPATSEAASAAAKMARLALNDADYGKAESYFNKIPSTDRNRPGLAVSLGRGLWFNFKNSNATETTDVARAEQLSQAKSYLREGVTNSNLDSLQYRVAEGALLLVEAHLAAGEVDMAVEQLETASIAPLDLMKQKHPAIAKAGRVSQYGRETSMTAIKTYMAALRKSPAEQQKWVDKASGVITLLRQELQSSDDPNDRKRLTGIYQLISKELLDQFDSISVVDQRIAFADNLATILESIERESDDARTVVWAGSTLLSVANTLSNSDAKDAAQPIFDQAVSALNRAESLGFGKGEQATALARELKRQRALAQRGAGKFDAAIEQFEELLKVKAGDLQMQLDAAETLHQKADADRQPKSYADAITGAGTHVDPKTKRKTKVIWGWLKLVKITRGNDRFAAAFYQSLYGMIEARYELGKVQNSPDGVAKALKELNNWKQRDPEFGGTAWKQKFEALAQRIASSG